MRRIATITLCFLMMLVLIGCTNQNEQISEPTTATNPEVLVQYNDAGEFIFNEGTTLCGIDVSGLTRSEAGKLLKNAVNGYSIDITVNGTEFHFTAEEIGLSFREAKLVDYEVAVKNGEDPTEHLPFVFNENYVRSTIAKELNVPSQNVSISYNSESKRFEFIEAVPGTRYDVSLLMHDIITSVKSLSSKCSLTAIGQQTSPAYTAETSTAIAALDNANSYLSIILVYGYTPGDSIGEYEVLTEDDIASFITFDASLNPILNESAVLAYAEEMGDLYSVGLNDGQFLTSHGYYTDMNITYIDQRVDAQALAEDITYCLRNKISGARYASYTSQGKGYAYDLDGSYVEIDLTAQRLWVYKDYECVLYTPIVTGNLSEEWDTPTGVYRVYQRIYPTRPGRVFRYWMPFYGAYGLHDANWRSEFRSDEYLYEGSHGCVNIPPEKFVEVYKHVSVGTPVIIYGGAGNGNPVTQEISGTDVYNVGIEAEKFTLDATPKYGTTDDLTYTSSNPEVAKISNDGVVTVLSTGTTTITVQSKDWTFCPSAEKIVTIQVHEDCSKVGHMIVNWKQTKAATCDSTGIEIGTCTSCDYSETRTIDITHKFYFPAYMHPQSWVVTTWPTCTEAGEKCRTCQKCGYQEFAEVSEEGHIPVCWHITKHATETDTGEMTAKCYFCGQKITKEIPATGN